MQRIFCLSLIGALLILAHSRSAFSQTLEKKCPSVKITCPVELIFDTTLIVTAEISGADPKVDLKYYWSVSSGRITRGQGTGSIAVDTSGIAGQSFTATLEIGGIAECPMIVSCSASPGDYPPPIIDVFPFDRYSGLTFREEKRRLTNLASLLLAGPDTKAYIVVYAGRRSRTKDSLAHVERAREYLIGVQGIAPERIVFADGGMREQLTFELHIMPYGLSPTFYSIIAPNKKPTIKNKARGRGRYRSH